MGKSSVSSFLKGYDRYAKGVTLKYMKKGSYETAIGGCCSIFAFTWLSYWVVINLISLLAPPGSFSTKTSTKLIQNDDGSYPVTAIPVDQLFTLYALTSTTVAQEDIDNYMVGLWF